MYSRIFQNLTFQNNKDQAGRRDISFVVNEIINLIQIYLKAEIYVWKSLIKEIC